MNGMIDPPSLRKERPVLTIKEEEEERNIGQTICIGRILAKNGKIDAVIPRLCKKNGSSLK